MSSTGSVEIPYAIDQARDAKGLLELRAVHCLAEAELFAGRLHLLLTALAVWFVFTLGAVASALRRRPNGRGVIPAR